MWYIYCYSKKIDELIGPIPNLWLPLPGFKMHGSIQPAESVRTGFFNKTMNEPGSPRDQYCMRAHRPELLSSTGPYVQQQRGSQKSGNLNLCFSKRFCSSSIYIYIALNCFSLVSYDSGIEIAEFDQVDLLLFSSCSAAFGCCGCINGSGLLTLEFRASG